MFTVVKALIEYFFNVNHFKVQFTAITWWRRVGLVFGMGYKLSKIEIDIELRFARAPRIQSIQMPKVVQNFRFQFAFRFISFWHFFSSYILLLICVPWSVSRRASNQQLNRESARDAAHNSAWISTSKKRKVGGNE